MRLIGTFDTEKQAYAFYSFLLKERIHNIYESYFDQQTGKKSYHLWIYDEDDFQIAMDWLSRYKEHPEDPAFRDMEMAVVSTPPPPQFTEIAKEENLKWRSTSPVRVKTRLFHVTFVHWILFVCASLFIWNNIQEEQIKNSKGILAGYLAHTPLEKQLLFDYPASFQTIDHAIAKYPMQGIEELKEIPLPVKEALEKAQQAPSWKGLYSYFVSVKKEGIKQTSDISLFEKIRQGQIWRLFTPCLLHADFLHILFNMAWLWILGKQIEVKIRWVKMGLIILIIGVVSNVAQYLMSGPSFLGFSGVIVGMAGFIWMRQRRAPWEGYALTRATLLFLLLFVLAMAVLGFLTFTLNILSLLEITPVIANTAHIVGGLCGMFLGCFSFFARGKTI